MSRKIGALSVGVVMMMLAINISAQSSYIKTFSFEADAVEALAIYKGSRETGYRGLQKLRAADVKFNVTDRAVIKQLIEAVKFNKPISAKLAMIPHATVFIKFRDGSIKQANLLNNYTYFDLIEDKLHTYPLTSGDLFDRYAQEVH
ncbi:MAG: hypothetical protein GTO24_23155 [candidate division Zixibacteria bacterium]|nr:hypothetical protein [candidate division Zixibacteria bacterium]